MLNKEIFNKGIDQLITEYKDRGFSMNKEKSDQWYDCMKNTDDTIFLKAIEECLCNCNHVPYMADVMKTIIAIKKEKSESRPTIPYI